jgi:hypothetical protein
MGLIAVGAVNRIGRNPASRSATRIVVANPPFHILLLIGGDKASQTRDIKPPHPVDPDPFSRSPKPR